DGSELAFSTDHGIFVVRSNGRHRRQIVSY
ncbi:MAG: hypothetical protein QOE29_1788, partial [Gaiellaceae bacterium]|nr:hypothetical protein [Gaiellaceae bacterium]